MAKLTFLFFAMHSEKCEKKNVRCEKMEKEDYWVYNKILKLNHKIDITYCCTIG